MMNVRIIIGRINKSPPLSRRMGTRRR